MAKGKKVRVARSDSEPINEVCVEHCVALPRVSLYMVTCKDGQGEKYNFVFARTDAEALNQFSREVVLKTSQLIFGEDPLHATDVSFLGSLLPHGNLHRLLGEITRRAIQAQIADTAVVQLSERKRQRKRP